MHGNNLKIRRDNFKTCIDILKSLKNQNGLNVCKIRRKANINTDVLKRYLSVLENEKYVGSREPGRSERYNGHVKKIYFLEQRGHEFISGWERYSAKFDLDNLEKQLI